MSGTIPPFPHMISYRLQGNFNGRHIVSIMYVSVTCVYVCVCVCVCLRLAFHLCIWGQYLDSFAKLRKETISIALYVYPSAWNNLARNGRIFMKFGI
jgi:hypothetical protein